MQQGSLTREKILFLRGNYGLSCNNCLSSHGEASSLRADFRLLRNNFCLGAADLSPYVSSFLFPAALNLLELYTAQPLSLAPLFLSSSAQHSFLTSALPIFPCLRHRSLVNFCAARILDFSATHLCLPHRSSLSSAPLSFSSATPLKLFLAPRPSFSNCDAETLLSQRTLSRHSCLPLPLTDSFSARQTSFWSRGNFLFLRCESFSARQASFWSRGNFLFLRYESFSARQASFLPRDHLLSARGPTLHVCAANFVSPARQLLLSSAQRTFSRSRVDFSRLHRKLCLFRAATFPLSA